MNVIHSNKRAVHISERCRSMVFLLLLLVLLFTSHGAWASCSGGPSTVTINLPSTVSVPRDTPVGTRLTAWVTSPATTNYWSCSTGVGQALGVRDMIGSFTTSNGTTISDGTGTYTVWKTSVPGVGIAVGIRFYTSSVGDCTGGTLGWSTWTTPPTTWAGQVCPSPLYAFSANYGSQTTVALVKIASISATGVVSGVVAQTAPVNPGNLTGQAISYQINPVTIVPLVCTTPDVVVSMGRHAPAEFKGANTFTSATSFSISLNNCPAGMNSIQYRIDPVTTVVNNAQSVVALDASSSATGVGVQLLDDNGNVFKLSTQTTFSGYDQNSGGTYTIPMKARYYQTGSTVGPGTANTAMTFTMTYL